VNAFDTFQLTTDVLSIIAALACAGIVLVAKRSALNLALASYLTLKAANDIVFLLFENVRDPFVAQNALLYVNVTAWLLLVVYVLFFSTALTTPLVRPLRARPVRVVLVALSAGFLVWVVAWPVQALAILAPDNPIEGIVWGAVPVFATLASIDALRRAAEGPARRRARAYLIAFLVNDLDLLKGGVLNNFSVKLPTLDALQSIANLVFIVLLVRALLAYQLFDFDLKVKWTLKRGTLVAIVLAVFFVATAIAEQYLQGYGFLAGGLAIGLLLFAIRPVERAIDRMADHAMPKTTGSADYIVFRKLEVYRAAVESEIETHGHDHQEHAVLERLRVKLGISREDADALQREARERAVEASVT
jgi:hypothetical protein